MTEEIQTHHAMERLENEAFGCDSQKKLGRKYHMVDCDQLPADIRIVIAAYHRAAAALNERADFKANLLSTQRHLNDALVENAALKTELTDQADEFNREKAMIRELLAKHI